MNKRDREQLRASIAKDLVQGQGENSATRELLRQYAPLQGVVSQATLRNPVLSGEPVENSMAPRATVARDADNKEKFDDALKRKSSSKGALAIASSSNTTRAHRSAAAPPEKHAGTVSDLAVVRAAYEKATGNQWRKSDTEAYQVNRLTTIPTSKIVSVLETLSQRTSARINSFNYFVKEIIAATDPRNRAWQKKKLERIAGRIRDRYVGTDCTAIDLLEDVNCACAREDMEFDNDLYNELAG